MHYSIPALASGVDRILDGFQPLPPVAPQAQIAAHLRREILAGRLPPGTRLPATNRLAARWGVTITVVQAALAPLVGEGLLLRRPRFGTIVRERPAAMRRVGIYRPTEPQREGRDHYARRLAAVVATRLAADGIAADLFTDLRPESDQAAPPPDLLAAIRGRQLDAVIATESNLRIAPWLAGLPLPVASCSAGDEATSVGTDLGQFAEAGVERLAARGCRSVGLVSALPANATRPDGGPHPDGALHRRFVSRAGELGLAARAAWIRTPPPATYIGELDAEAYGYAAARALLDGGELPDGLLVFTDLVARGVVMGLLARPAGGAPPPCLVLHRNPELGLFCPLPADFLDSGIADMADALIAQVAAQRHGRATAPILLPYRLVRGG